MSGLALGLIVVAALIFAVWHGLAVLISRALLTYSRSQLESQCERRGRPERADAIDAAWEKTERSTAVHAIASGLLLLLLLGIAEEKHPESISGITIIAAWFAGGLIVRMIAGVAGRVFAEPVLDWAWPLITMLNTTALPVLSAGAAIEASVQRRRNGPRRSARPRPLSVEVEIWASGEADHELPEQTRERIERLVALDQHDVGELMTPRSSMIALPSTTNGLEAARTIVSSGHSRIPLFGENRDDIVGLLYAKDLFAAMLDAGNLDSVRPKRLARSPLRVPETKRASDLINEMRKERVHLAIVLDEYGGVAGVITLEDLFEEVVGPIDDEYDIPTPDDPIQPVSPNQYEVDAGMSLDDLNDRLDLDLPTDADYQTIGGFAFNALGRLPEEGVSFVDHDREIQFTIVEVGDHSIRRIRIDLKPGASLERSAS